jgi:hypothetical protein
LGTSTSKEAKEYFSDMQRHRIKFEYGGPKDDHCINMVCNLEMSLYMLVYQKKLSSIYIYIYIYFFFGGVGLCPLGTVDTSGLLYKPQMIDEGDCGATGGLKIEIGRAHV